MKLGLVTRHPLYLIAQLLKVLIHLFFRLRIDKAAPRRDSTVSGSNALFSHSDSPDNSNITRWNQLPSALGDSVVCSTVMGRRREGSR